MDAIVDLHDVQGLAVKPYASLGYPKARFVCYRVHQELAGRGFLESLLPRITSGKPWNTDNRPDATTDVAFTYEGLKHLGLPERSLHSFPDAFSMGMRARRAILDDIGASDPQNWDPVWNDNRFEQPVHMLVTINGRGDTASAAHAAVERRYAEIELLRRPFAEQVELLAGHRGPAGQVDAPYQEASTTFINGVSQPIEHFGYRDGISTTYFKGCGSDPDEVIGGGKPTGGDPRTTAGWAPLETGEFLLGYRDEASEYPEAPGPPVLARNGTFLVVRKLHQNVATFRQFVADQQQRYAGGAEEFSAKLVGRWKNGAPLATFPTWEAAKKFGDELAQVEHAVHQSNAAPDLLSRYRQLLQQLRGFDYNQDLDGAGCPTGAHMRRINPRGSLEFNTRSFASRGALDNRRRIIRRGLPYGQVEEPATDGGEHGVFFLVINASIERQFEFVQQQWVAYGNDFKLANDKDPLIGNHSSGGGRFVIQADPSGEKPPHLVNQLPTFVETRGGDYFFLPSLTALQQIARGTVDPT